MMVSMIPMAIQPSSARTSGSASASIGRASPRRVWTTAISPGSHSGIGLLQPPLARVRKNVMQFARLHASLNLGPIFQSEKIPVLLPEVALQIGRNTQETLPFVHQHIVLADRKPRTVNLCVPHQFVLLV